ncbi:hypothetical protein MLD38_038650 [Melastoma candidum]|uniref:Uncharacterized protein n=1 Tax=Melastoma candidum TaxID=119954 RepID=A0ACB9L0B3_9MYRT|nr:hypothetical protein MLD38_038650 [Melastoma candidum]
MPRMDRAEFLGEVVVQLDKINPQVVLRMVSAFSRWKHYDETRQNLVNFCNSLLSSWKSFTPCSGASENRRLFGQPIKKKITTINSFHKGETAQIRNEIIKCLNEIHSIN